MCLPKSSAFLQPLIATRNVTDWAALGVTDMFRTSMVLSAAEGEETSFLEERESGDLLVGGTDHVSGIADHS